MTLLESIVAFVLLAVVGVACLDLARGATGLESSSADWSRAVATGESVMAAAVAGVPEHELANSSVAIARRPWAGDAGVDVIDVEVSLPSGATFHVSRIVRAHAASGANRAAGEVR